MAENSKITQISQVGPETAPGVPPAAFAGFKRLHGLALDLAPEGNVEMFKPEGYKHATLSILGKIWSSADLQIAADYHAVLYALQGAIQKVSGTGGGSAKTYLFQPSSTDENAVQTYTFEEGNKIRGRRTKNNNFTDFGYSLTREQVKFMGKTFGQAVEDPQPLSGNEIQTITITGGPTGGTFTLTFSGQTTAAIAYNATPAVVQAALELLSNIGVGNVVCSGAALPAGAVAVQFQGPTLGFTDVAAITATGSLTGGTTPAVVITETQKGVATITELPAVPMTPGSFSVYVDSTSGALGTTLLTREFSLNYKAGNLRAPLWAVRGDTNSFVAAVEADPKHDFDFTVEADTQGMGFLSNLTAGSTLFIRVLSTGPAIAGGGNHTFQHDLAIKLNKPHEYTDEAGVVEAVKYTGEIVHDSTWTRGHQFTLITDVAAL